MRRAPSPHAWRRGSSFRGVFRPFRGLLHDDSACGEGGTLGKAQDIRSGQPPCCGNFARRACGSFGRRDLGPLRIERRPLDGARLGAYPMQGFAGANGVGLHLEIPRTIGQLGDVHCRLALDHDRVGEAALELEDAGLVNRQGVAVVCRTHRIVHGNSDLRAQCVRAGAVIGVGGQ